MDEQGKLQQMKFTWWDYIKYLPMGVKTFIWWVLKRR